MPPPSRATVGSETELNPHSAEFVDDADSHFQREGHATMRQLEPTAVAARVKGGMQEAHEQTAGLLGLRSPQRIVSGTTRAPTDELIEMAPGIFVPVSE